MPRNDPNTILAIDPGLRELGWAVLQRRNIVAGGVLALRRLPKAQRYSAARRQLLRWQRQHHAGTIVVEKTYRHPVPWLDGLDRLTRSLRRLASKEHLVFATYAPQRVRQVVLGNGKASKRAVAEFLSGEHQELRLHLTQDRKWKERHWQNHFDAVALGRCHQILTNPPSRSRSSG